MRRKAEKICPTCGKTFMGNNASVYCGVPCRKEAERKRRKSSNVYECEFCGTKFLSKRRKKYCGDKCRNYACKRPNVKKKLKKPIMSIEQVALLSREAGLSYGVYVEKMGL